MECKNKKILPIAFVITLAASGLALGQDSVALSVEPSALRALETGGIAEGQKVKVEGIVINRIERSFTVRDSKGTEIVVVVSDKTVIKKERKGWFRRDKSFSADDILCGLRLKVEGQGNGDGQLVAQNISIDKPNLTCEIREFRVYPVETRLTDAEWELDQADQNAASLWTGGTIEHCGNCRPVCGERCAVSGCPGRGGCNQRE